MANLFNEGEFYFVRNHNGQFLYAEPGDKLQHTHIGVDQHFKLGKGYRFKFEKVETEDSWIIISDQDTGGNQWALDYDVNDRIIIAPLDKSNRNQHWKICEGQGGKLNFQSNHRNGISLVFSPTSGGSGSPYTLKKWSPLMVPGAEKWFSLVSTQDAKLFNEGEFYFVRNQNGQFLYAEPGDKLQHTQIGVAQHFKLGKGYRFKFEKVETEDSWIIISDQDTGGNQWALDYGINDEIRIAPLDISNRNQHWKICEGLGGELDFQSNLRNGFSLVFNPTIGGSGSPYTLKKRSPIMMRGAEKGFSLVSTQDTKLPDAEVQFTDSTTFTISICPSYEKLYLSGNRSGILKGVDHKTYNSVFCIGRNSNFDYEFDDYRRDTYRWLALTGQTPSRIDYGSPVHITCGYYPEDPMPTRSSVKRVLWGREPNQVVTWVRPQPTASIPKIDGFLWSFYKKMENREEQQDVIDNPDGSLKDGDEVLIGTEINGKKLFLNFHSEYSKPNYWPVGLSELPKPEKWQYEGWRFGWRLGLLNERWFKSPPLFGIRKSEEFQILKSSVNNAFTLSRSRADESDVIAVKIITIPKAEIGQLYLSVSKEFDSSNTKIPLTGTADQMIYLTEFGFEGLLDDDLKMWILNKSGRYFKGTIEIWV